MTLAIIALGAYLLGSIPTAYVVTRAVAGIDIRTVSSGNVGATNASRVLGWKWALMIFAVDAGKGWLAVWGSTRWSFEMWSYHPDHLQTVAAAAVILGHMFPVFLKGRGGKGVATSAGVFFAMAPMAMLMAFTIFAMGLSVSRRISVGSMLAALFLPVALWGLEASEVIQWVGRAAAAVVMGMHWKNIVRLWNGTEPKITSG